MISVKQLWDKLTQNDRKILLILVGIFLLFSFFLYDDSFFDLNQNLQLKPIGQIVNSENDVRQKYAKKFSWSKAKESSDVHTGDSIFTGTESEAKIVLIDGAEVSVRQNSLVVFNITEDQMNMDFKFGKLIGKLTGENKLKLNADGQKFEFSGTDTLFELKRSNDGKGFDIKTLKGQLSVNNQKITPAEKLEVKKGVLKKETLPAIALETSTPPKFSHTRFNTKVRLSWKSNVTFRRFHVQVSKNKDFTDLYFSEKIVKSSYAMARYPNHGAFFVRVLGEDPAHDSQIASSTLSFEVFPTQGPEITLPRERFKILSKTDEDGNPVEILSTQIAWTAPVTGPYQVQIAKDYGFQNIVVDEKVETPPWTHTPVKEAGTYFVRVRVAPTNDEDISWSQKISFTYELEAFQALPAPELLTKNIEYTAPNASDPRIAWTQVAGANSYQVQFSLDEHFNEIREYNSDKLEFKWKRYAPGLFYTRVAAVTPKGKVGTWSAPGTLKIDFAKPILEQPQEKIVKSTDLDGADQVQDFKLKWTEFPSADLYQIEVSKDDSFKKVQKFESRTPASVVQIQNAGQYKVRVRAVASNGEPLSPYSDPKELKYILKKVLRPPQPLEPFDQATLFFQSAKSNQAFWFEWRSVEQADNYTLEISTTPDFSNIVFTEQIDTPRFFNKKVLPNGDVFWRVRANADSRTSDWSPVSKLTTYAGRRQQERTPAGKTK